MAGRPYDVFGVRYYFYNSCDNLEIAISPLLKFDNEHGVEMFYNFAVTPWFQVSADLQCFQPVICDNDNIWVGGVSVNLKF